MWAITSKLQISNGRQPVSSALTISCDAYATSVMSVCLSVCNVGRLWSHKVGVLATSVLPYYSILQRKMMWSFAHRQYQVTRMSCYLSICWDSCFVIKLNHIKFIKTVQCTWLDAIVRRQHTTPTDWRTWRVRRRALSVHVLSGRVGVAWVGVVSVGVANHGQLRLRTTSV